MDNMNGIDIDNICSAIIESNKTKISFYFFYNSKFEYNILICALERLGYKWNTGHKPSDWTPPLPYVDEGCLDITRDKCISYGYRSMHSDSLKVSDFILNDCDFDSASNDEFEAMMADYVG